jgi:parallel beta-helix repeat protein
VERSPSVCLRLLAPAFLALLALSLLTSLPPRALAGASSVEAGCPSNAIRIAVGDSTARIQNKLNSPGRDRTFCWESGLHRVRGTLRMHTGDTFLGITDPETGRGAVIDGSRRIRGWNRVSPRRWVARVRGLAPPRINLPPGAACFDGTKHCAYPDDVFWGQRALRRVWKPARQKRGTYYVNYAKNRIYIGKNPSRAPVSRAVPLAVVDGRSQPLINVLPGGAIQGLTVQKVGVGLQTGAIFGYQYTVDDVDVHLSHARGVQVDDLSTVRNSSLYSNGQGGLSIGQHLSGATGGTALIENNHVYGNAWIKCLGICAGMKASNVGGVLIKNNNVHGNFGVGIWIDNDSINYVIENNSVMNNRGAGIEMEISYDGIVTRNIVNGNALNPLKEAAGAGGIYVLSSGSCSSSCPPMSHGGITISHNAVGAKAEPNAYGIVLRQLNRGSGRYGQHLVQSVSVTSNTVTLSGGWTGAVDPSDATGIYTRGNTYDDNDYVVPGSDMAIFRWQSSTGLANAWLTFAQWQAAGNDTSGTITEDG